MRHFDVITKNLRTRTTKLIVVKLGLTEWGARDMNGMMVIRLITSAFPSLSIKLTHQLWNTIGPL